MEIIKRCLEDVSSIEHLYLFGVKPLLYSKMNELFNLVKERNIPTLMTTNAVYLNQYFLQIVDAQMRDFLSKIQRGVACSYPFPTIAFLENGMAAFCVDYLDIIIGDLNKDSLKEIWDNENAKKYRQYIQQNGFFQYVRNVHIVTIRFLWKRNKRGNRTLPERRCPIFLPESAKGKSISILSSPTVTLSILKKNSQNPKVF